MFRERLVRHPGKRAPIFDSQLDLKYLECDDREKFT